MKDFFGRRLGVPVWALALIVFVSFAVGAVGGASGNQEGADSELAAANQARSDAENRAINAERTSRERLQAEFAERDLALSQRGEALNAREQALKAGETAKKANSIEGDGVYQVGVDIQPGTWRTPGSGQSCYWETTSKGGDILGNDNVTGPTVVVVPASAFTFTTKRCGTWTRSG